MGIFEKFQMEDVFINIFVYLKRKRIFFFFLCIRSLMLNMFTFDL